MTVWTLSGDWRAPALPDWPPRPTTSGLKLRAEALQGWDARLAARLWGLLRSASSGMEVQLDDSLPEGLRAVIAQAGATAAPAPAPAAAPAPKPAVWWRGLERLGRRVLDGHGQFAVSLGFFGQTLLALARVPRGGSGLRWRDLVWQVEQTGPRSLPIVSLVSVLVGMILAYMGAEQLRRFGAQVFIADLVTIGSVREIAALMMAILLAGRVGAAFAAELASMNASEEIDALRTLGLDPVEHLVLPRLLALLLVAPLLTVYAALLGMVGGWVVAVGVQGVDSFQYLQRAGEALTPAHLGIGLFKGTLYAGLVGLAGCRQGLNAQRSAEGVGRAVTASVVQAIVWIVVAASVTTIVFQRLGW